MEEWTRMINRKLTELIGLYLSVNDDMRNRTRKILNKQDNGREIRKELMKCILDYDYQSTLKILHELKSSLRIQATKDCNDPISIFDRMNYLFTYEIKKQLHYVMELQQTGEDYKNSIGLYAYIEDQICNLTIKSKRDFAVCLEVFEAIEDSYFWEDHIAYELNKLGKSKYEILPDMKILGYKFSNLYNEILVDENGNFDEFYYEYEDSFIKTDQEAAIFSMFGNELAEVSSFYLYEMVMKFDPTLINLSEMQANPKNTGLRKLIDWQQTIANSSDKTIYGSEIFMAYHPVLCIKYELLEYVPINKMFDYVICISERNLCYVWNASAEENHLPEENQYKRDQDSLFSFTAYIEIIENFRIEKRGENYGIRIR